MRNNKFIALLLAVILPFNTFISFPVYACWLGDTTSVTSVSTTASSSALDSRKQSGHDKLTGQKTAGDPVYLHDGDFVYTHQDLLMSGRGFNLELARTYKTMSHVNGPLGLGWDFNYNKRVVFLSNNDVEYLNGSNTPAHFTYSAGSYIVPANLFLTFTVNNDGTSIIADTHGNQEFYNADGTLARVVDRNGNYLNFTYDPAGKLPIVGIPVFWSLDSVTPRLVANIFRLTQVTSSTGQTFTFSYNDNGLIAKVTDSTSRSVSYAYDIQNNLIAVTDPMGNNITYGYESRVLTQITDAKNQVYITNTYNPMLQVIAQEYGNGTWYYSYGNGSCTVTDPNGKSWNYAFDANGDPTTITDPSGRVTTKTYNNNNTMQLASVTLPNGNQTLYESDSKGNTTKVTRKSSTTSDPDIVTQFTYDPAFNFIKTATDPKGNVTTYNYDTKGNLTGIVYPVPTTGGTAPTAAFTYNNFGQAVTATNPVGIIAQYTYSDSTGYLTSVVSDFGDSTHLNATTQFAYDSRGNVTSVTDAKNNTTTFTYDILNRLTQTTFPAPFNYVTKYSYDANGNLIELDKQASSDGTQWQTTQYVYDLLDSLIQTKQFLDGTNVLNTYFGYDPNGNRNQITDANGKVTKYTYSERNLLASVIDAKNAITAYVYDNNGNLQTITDANNNVTTYFYDGFDRLNKTTYANSTYEGYSYDANSNLLSKRTRSGSVINYAYDNLNRLTTKTYPDTTSVAYGYDNASRLTSVTGGGAAAISYQYDALNRVTQTAAAGKTISYEYDKLGNRTKLTYPDASFITYQYDNLNRLTGIQDQGNATIAGYGYDTLSRRTNVNLANNTQTVYTYDSLNRLSNLSNTGGGGTISTFGYSYDAAGNRLSKAAAGGTETYGYDNLNQLTSVQYPTAAAFSNTGFNYDPLGNRTTMTNGAATTYAANNLNQYTQVNTNTLNYDANGNLTNHNGFTLTYDYENRLTGATDGTTTAAYVFDAFGRRISKTVGGVTTNFLYDGDNLIAEYDLSGALLRKYIFSDEIDEPVAIINGTNTYYYNRDGLGSVTELTDNTGAVAEKYQYDVFGKTIIKDSSDNVLTQSGIGNRFGFTGRELDAETGLYFYRARMYSPDLGRFLQTDPVGYLDSTNLYQYCLNSPTNYIDPYGLVSLNLVPTKEKLREYVDKINPPDVYSVAGHGAAYSMLDSDKTTRISPAKLAEKILQDTAYRRGQDVQLFSCNTGSRQNGFGQKLANELTKLTGIETTVIAPSDIVGVNPKGEYVVKNSGKWQNFKGILNKAKGEK